MHHVCTRACMCVACRGESGREQTAVLQRLARDPVPQCMHSISSTPPSNRQACTQLFFSSTRAPGRSSNPLLPLTGLIAACKQRYTLTHAAAMLKGCLRAALAAHSTGTAASAFRANGALPGSTRAYHVARLASRGVISVTGPDCVAFMQVRVQQGTWLLLRAAAHARAALSVLGRA